MIGSANGRFKTSGQVMEVGTGRRPIADLYTTVLRAYGIEGVTVAEDQFEALMPEIRV
jgi:hypothetical protein